MQVCPQIHDPLVVRILQVEGSHIRTSRGLLINLVALREILAPPDQRLVNLPFFVELYKISNDLRLSSFLAQILVVEGVNAAARVPPEVRRRVERLLCFNLHFYKLFRLAV